MSVKLPVVVEKGATEMEYWPLTGAKKVTVSSVPVSCETMTLPFGSVMVTMPSKSPLVAVSWMT